MDTNVAAIVQPVLEIGAMVAFGVLASVARKYALVAEQNLHLNLTAAQQDQIEQAAHTVAQVGETMLRQSKLYQCDIHVQNPAILQLAGVVEQLAGDAVQAQGLTRDSIAHMLVAKIDDSLGLAGPPSVPLSQAPAGVASVAPTPIPVTAIGDKP